MLRAIRDSGAIVAVLNGKHGPSLLHMGAID
jgi:hypothetical protein